MPILKCKMCGGDLNIVEGQTVCECEYCGTKQTLPRIDNDRKLALYDRASHFRRNNEFDKASVIYEQILSEDPNDAEAYWSLVLCRYGIEYVEDPVSHKRIPTVNRAQFTSIFNDNDYEKAIEHATVDQKNIYEEEAKAIDDIQKGILEVSSKEEPFDVFICYKETDNNGRRTMDSVLAQDIYKELTNEGYEVFFSRITLEDKLGSAYEPYIFAALNSAKVMIVVGTRPEHFNAVWVKNEWSRYLALIKKGEKKTLIPAYRDMDPYDLPEEFAYLQAQDMSKLGFMQDLIRGIKKILDSDKKAVKETVVINNQTNTSVSPLLERIKIFLEDGDFKSAGEYCDRVLDIDPKNGEAYYYKFLVEKGVKDSDELIRYYKQYFKSDNLETKTAVEEDIDHISDVVSRYSIKNYLDEDTIRSKYQFDRTYSSSLQDRIDQKNYIEKEFENDRYYPRAVNCGNEDAKKTYDEIISIYDHRIAQEKHKDEEKIRNISDRYKEFLNEVDQTTNQLYESVSEKRENDYQSCIQDLEKIRSISQTESLLLKLTNLDGYKDSSNYQKLCEQKLAELKAIEKQTSDKNKKRKIIISVIGLLFIITIGIVYMTVINPMNKYSKALSHYDNAYNNDDDFYAAYSLFKELGEYKEAPSYKNEMDQYYKGLVKQVLSNTSVGDVITFGHYEQDNNTQNGEEEIAWVVLSKENSKMFLVSYYALDAQEYNKSSKQAFWENCSLRSWLNSNFYKTAFTDVEQSIIQLSTIKTNNKKTEDRVFLLSKEEVLKYFDSQDSRKCKPTNYTQLDFAYNGYGYCWWWLRDSDSESEFIPGVSYTGEFDTYIISAKTGAVRPAMWIDFE